MVRNTRHCCKVKVGGYVEVKLSEDKDGKFQVRLIVGLVQS